MTARDDDRLRDAVRALEAWGHARDWLGTDPYEGLNAIRPRPLMATRIGRRILVQMVKRSPVDIRPLVGIEPEHNSVGVAQIVMGYAQAGALGDAGWAERLDRTLERLIAMRRPEYEEACWSYHFDLETRAFFYPKTMPNTIATAWAGHALLDAHAVTGDPRLVEIAKSAGDFFLDRISRTEAEQGAYFGYFVGDRTEIHNANMLACGFLARLAAHDPRSDLLDAMAAGVDYAVAHQAPEGSWVYGEPANMRWIDGFHTGYVLDSLWYCCAVRDRPEWRAALDRGLDYYARELFLPDGTAKYYDNRVHPLDTQSYAQGIRTFALTSEGRPERAELAWRILDAALATMRRPDGAFRFQRRRFWRNDAPHVRWAQAPMFDAMTRLTSAG